MSIAAMSLRVRQSDPKPSHCSMCFRGPSDEVVFYDCGAAFDAGTVIDKNTQAFISGSDDLHLCDGCVREITEAAAYKPVQHTNLLRELDRLRNENEHWKATVMRLRKELELQLTFEPRRKR